MNSKEIALSITAPTVAIAAMVFGITVDIQHAETQRLTACVEAGGAYVMAPNAAGRECRR